MALSDEFVDQHIAQWSIQLGSGFRAYRKHWPSWLFHHAPMETALAIIRDGNLRARDDPQREQLQDVAAGGVIDNRQEAHGRVRLYFRPRNPTQFHIEGVRKNADCTYGPNAHAPVLVMFVLDAKRVLARPDVLFSDQNMQNNWAQTGCDEAFFSNIPFGKVFHEGGIADDYSIIAHRCAEVLPASPLPLADVLSGIWFRSEPERDTFLFKLGSQGERWQSLCSVSDELKVFDKRFPFVADIDLSREGVSFRLNHRHDLQNVSLAIQAYNEQNELRVDFRNDDFKTYNQSGGRWIHRVELEPSNYLVRLQLENHPAYEARIRLDDSLF
ncbi:DarT ssDNA thymidine ADP-ribosyltransferase family protein [uncultured Roseobacter sp.]|uniref:DarT ssDNA thymidine ADP-ribosyltransferase family protein n=1 Tax=uncultured Roseobacter sp. TaxID=114847 RepID=UPI002604C70B|nr:DarT ssDNA thymidine ADP-ribosyltransferase family protein [uncultured Roseobacter sp.]